MLLSLLLLLNNLETSKFEVGVSDCLMAGACAFLKKRVIFCTILLALFCTFCAAWSQYQVGRGEAYISDIEGTDDPNLLLLTVKFGKIVNETDYYTLDILSDYTLSTPFDNATYETYTRRQLFDFNEDEEEVIIHNVTPHPHYSNSLDINLTRNGQSMIIEDVEAFRSYTAEAISFQPFSFNSINTTFIMVSQIPNSVETISIRFDDNNDNVRAMSVDTGRSDNWLGWVANSDSIYVSDDAEAPMIQVRASLFLNKSQKGRYG